MAQAVRFPRLVETRGRVRVAWETVGGRRRVDYGRLQEGSQASTDNGLLARVFAPQSSLIEYPCVEPLRLFPEASRMRVGKNMPSMESIDHALLLRA